MKLRLRRILWLSILSTCSVVGVQACKKKDDGAPAPLVPPSLEFLGAETPSGDEFDPEADIEVGCDRSLTFYLGPEGDDSGTIENWSLRPPNVCGSLQQCGYVLLEVLSETGESLATFEQAVAAPYIDLSRVDLDSIREFRATLILGDSGVAYQNDGVVVSASWQARVSSTCENLGGAGGGGPDAGTGGRAGTGGESSTGGVDGSGGIDGVIGGQGGMGGGPNSSG